MDYSFNNMKGNLFWEMPALNYTDISNSDIDKYFFTENNIKDKNSKIILKLIFRILRISECDYQ